ncbi:MAG: hypothetical protein V2J89_16675 [Halieaceae bacterium]|nr:hypothetical protein [Halieaceae bacterium]
MKLFKGLGIAVASVLLSGCFYVQLSGSVGGAVVTVTPLRDQGVVVGTGDTTTPEDWIGVLGQATWDGLDDRAQLLLIGTANVDVGTLDPAALYLVTATGGMDYDANRDGLVDSAASPVSGQLRTVLTGAELMAGNIRVNALTELAYQNVRTSIATAEDAAILQRLASIASTLVKDVDGDGDVDYDDILDWGFWLGEDDIEIGGDSYAEFLTGVRAGIDDDEALAFLDRLINEQPIAGEGDWELTVSGQLTGTLTVAVPATVIAVTGDQVPRTGDTEVIRQSIDQLVEESGGGPVSNVVVNITTDEPEQVVLLVSFDTTLPGLGAVTYDLDYVYIKTGGDSGADEGGDSGDAGASGLPEVVAGQSFELIYCCENTGSPYSNGDTATFTFTEAGELVIDGAVISDSFEVVGSEYIWIDQANGFEYALFVLDGAFKEVNVLGIGKSPFYGQWGTEP